MITPNNSLWAIAIYIAVTLETLSAADLHWEASKRVGESGEGCRLLREEGCSVDSGEGERREETRKCGVEMGMWKWGGGKRRVEESVGGREGRRREVGERV